MRKVDIPPEGDDFTADPVELFFDLAFVFAFSRLVYHLVHHPDWGGVGEFALLLVMIWIAWSQFTWSANAVAGNARPVRLLFLVGTVASVPMAASVTTALGQGGPTFAIPLGIILSLGLFTMVFGLPRDHPARRSIGRYSIPNLVAVAVMAGGSYLDDGARVGAWAIAMLVVVAGTVAAGRDEWLVRPGHFAERHGLIVIVALGEVIVAMGAPLAGALEEGSGLAGTTVAAMIAAGSFACGMWWGYFDRVNRALEHRHSQIDDGRSSGRYARDVYTYWHLLIVAGVILVAAALEEIALHPEEVLAASFQWMFVGGMVLFFGGVALAVWRAYSVLATERVVGGAVLVVLLAVFGRSMNGLAVLITADVILLGALAFEHRRIERPEPASPDPLAPTR